ncbi:hypothetical protein BDBG_06416 [Blastomyces gilchristii SLH14081]|uniref:J domain-containing protein n=1 Tax=Blastomyces gilchristii (strain SLH14081) TaxID=559298 RepID=A0A179UR64_BLAGS|nr:uncharacterized protein BDBG_06416 [Blastomyces gilchristii SLH14081]OAT10595.1 hypothetical protein BDBG_06416 [Blastomyces gilchristii SLH14081]
MPTVPYPCLPSISPLGDISTSCKRFKQSPPPDNANLMLRLLKSEMVIAVPCTKPDAVQNGDERPHSSLNIVFKSPASTVSDPSDREEPHRSQQKVSCSAVTSSSKGKGKENITPAEQAVEVMLQALSTNPYEILGVPDPSELENIKQAYKCLALLLHPDKNKHQHAKEVFKRLNWAGEALRVSDASFAGNAFGDEGESDGDGDVPMPDYEPRPVPDVYIEKLYTQATPFVKHLFENPLNFKAENELKQINELITQEVKNHGVQVTMKHSVFIIQYHLLASQALIAHHII